MSTQLVEKRLTGDLVTARSLTDELLERMGEDRSNHKLWINLRDRAVRDIVSCPASPNTDPAAYSWHAVCSLCNIHVPMCSTHTVNDHGAVPGSTPYRKPFN